MIHVWVDPHYGSDTAAAAANPAGQTECGAVRNMPHDLLEPAPSNQPLLHAPYPFRTVTAAAAYLSTRLVLSPLTGYRASHGVIHLLPGLYSPTTAQYGPNGLFRNGETFPIRLPANVTVQGTSALNTVFMLNSEGVTGPVFEFGLAPAGTGPNVIDSVSIFAVDRPVSQGGQPRWSSAIFIESGIPAHVTVTNCFIGGNGIGVLANASNDGSVTHTVILANNTFVWNEIGVWNGQVALQTGSRGLSRFVCLNNIFDATPPISTGCLPPFPWPQVTTRTSDFEGMDASDLNVSSPNPGNYNAYETGKYNLATAFPLYGLPPTAARTTPAGLPPINLSPVTGNQTGVLRGTLYVRDLLCHGPFAAQTGSVAFDRSPHDFRLSPAVADANSTPQPPGKASPPGNGRLNPLVDAGWCSTFPMTMANGLQLSHPPGYVVLTAGSQPTWEFSSWDEDCEGFGNPRIADHPVYVGPYWRFIDIGADELGELIAIGYRYGTTHVVAQPATTVPAMNNRFLWYLGPPPNVPAGQPAPTNKAKPRYRRIDALGSPRAPPYNLPTWWSVWQYGATPYYQPTPADITPHLFPDIHPWLTLGFGGPTNPDWLACSSLFYNADLFVDPGVGVINPPGSYAGFSDSQVTVKWLDGISAGQGNTDFPALGAAPPLGGPFDPTWNCSFVSVDDWCRITDGQGRQMETFPDTYSTPTIHAIRFTLEVPNQTTWSDDPLDPLRDSNIQSFLVMARS